MAFLPGSVTAPIVGDGRPPRSPPDSRHALRFLAGQRTGTTLGRGIRTPSTCSCPSCTTGCASSRAGSDARSRATLDTTAVVHEAYLKLVRAPRADLRDRAHFLVARVSRDAQPARGSRARAPRGQAWCGRAGGEPRRGECLAPDAQLDAIEALDEALERLALLDPRLCRAVEHRYFGGLSLEETAEALGVSLATAKRDLRSARAWLAAELADDVLA